MSTTPDSGETWWHGAVLQMKYCNEEVFGEYTLLEGEESKTVGFCMPPAGIMEVTSGSNPEVVAWSMSHNGEELVSEGAPFSSTNGCDETPPGTPEPVEGTPPPGDAGPPGAPGPPECGDWEVWELTMSTTPDSGETWW